MMTIRQQAEIADNILSHHLTEYVAHVRSRREAESVTLPIGQ